MEKYSYFISDLHLGLNDSETEKQKEDLLVEFLLSIRSDAENLFILGDLFDYWFEYKRVIQKGFYKIFAALKELSEAGVKIYYLIGNHDFMHKDFFYKEFNATVLQTDLEVEIHGKRFYLSHGDDHVLNDNGYKILKKILRNKLLQNLYSKLHPNFGIWLASRTSKKSRKYTDGKNFTEDDGLIKKATEKISAGFDFVIMGHTHLLKEIKINNGIYLNLGTWLDKPLYAVFKNDKIEIVKLKTKQN